MFSITMRPADTSKHDRVVFALPAPDKIAARGEARRRFPGWVITRLERLARA